MATIILSLSLLHEIIHPLRGRFCRTHASRKRMERNMTLVSPALQHLIVIDHQAESRRRQVLTIRCLRHPSQDTRPHDEAYLHTARESAKHLVIGQVDTIDRHQHTLLNENVSNKLGTHLIGDQFRSCDAAQPYVDDLAIREVLYVNPLSIDSMDTVEQGLRGRNECQRGSSSSLAVQYQKVLQAPSCRGHSCRRT